ncbi:hypothetical protein BaRGS_00027189, partial [Batillaria attramentaria]
PLASVIINMVNCRACVVLSGILCLAGFTLSTFVNFYLLFLSFTLVGVGRALGYTGSLMVLAYYFPNSTSMVTGICMAGAAMGMFIHPPLFAFLDEMYGLQGAFLLSGAVAFHGTLCGLLMRPSRFERELELKIMDTVVCFERRRVQGSHVRHVFCADSQDWLSVLADRAFLSFLLSTFFFVMAYDTLLIVLPTYTIRLSGLSETEASFAASVTGISSVVSRLLGGVLAHDRRVGSLLLYCGILGVETLSTLAAPPLLLSGQAGAFTYSLLVGLYTGSAVALINPVTVKVIGLHKLATGLGINLFFTGVGALIGAPLLGENLYPTTKETVTPRTNHADLSFFLPLAGMFGLSVAFGLLVAYIRPSAATDEYPDVPPSHPDRPNPEDVETTGSSPTSLCHVTLGATSTAYGMELCAVRGRQGQLVTTVDFGSPAAAAGLQQGDIIVEVNGDDVRMEDIHQVVGKIRACGDQVALLVLRCQADNTDRETGDTDRQTDNTDRQTDNTDRETDDTDRQSDNTDCQTDNTGRQTDNTDRQTDDTDCQTNSTDL